FTYAMRFIFEATNNEAVYEALIASLRIAEQMSVKNLQAHVDSRLVANQVNSSYIAKEPGIVQYLNKVKTLAKSFKEFSIKQIPRSENKKADALTKIASTSFAHLSKQVLVEDVDPDLSLYFITRNTNRRKLERERDEIERKRDERVERENEMEKKIDFYEKEI
ncbi:reverse transcriptase domain-containing protein, partial [Tanacetum coccineum]